MPRLMHCSTFTSGDISYFVVVKHARLLVGNTVGVLKSIHLHPRSLSACVWVVFQIGGAGSFAHENSRAGIVSIPEHISLFSDLCECCVLEVALHTYQVAAAKRVGRRQEFVLRSRWRFFACVLSYFFF